VGSSLIDTLPITPIEAFFTSRGHVLARPARQRRGIVPMVIEIDGSST
jgi:hypothetical protein